jgi:hypothetical protein
MTGVRRLRAGGRVSSGWWILARRRAEFSGDNAAATGAVVISVEAPGVVSAGSGRFGI